MTFIPVADKNFNYAINHFDFEKVCGIMKLLNWKWQDHKYSPTVEEMKNNVSELYELAKSCFDKEICQGREENYAYSGGFKVWVMLDGSVDIEFILEDSHGRFW